MEGKNVPVIKPNPGDFEVRNEYEKIRNLGLKRIYNFLLSGFLTCKNQFWNCSDDLENNLGQNEIQGVLKSGF